MKDLLQSFCAPETDTRFQLARPFSIDAYSYASNGHIAVRVPKVGGVPELEEFSPYRSAVPRINWPDGTAEWVMPPEPPPADGVCFACSGTGRVSTCPECDGDGEVSWESPRHIYHAPCLECEEATVVPGRGENTFTCPLCAGTGDQWIWAGMDVAGGHFSTIYIARIARLPQVQVAIGKNANSRIPDEPPLWFRCNGGLEGVLVPRRKPQL